MMNKRQLQKLVKKLASVSFENGKLLESQIIKSVKVLESMPRYEAILTLSEYLKELKRMQKDHTMYVETTIPLALTQLKRVRKIVEKKIKITKVEAHINPQIIGGLKLRVGDVIWDNSVSGKINQLKEAIASGRSN